MFTKIAHIPRQQYVWVDSRFTHVEPCGWVEAIWVGVTSIPARAWGINVLLRDGGALYRNLPPHAISFSQKVVFWRLQEAQLWDCYAFNFTLLENDNLSGLRVSAMLKTGKYTGEYLFSAAHIDDAYSMTPEQDKEFLFIRLENARLTIQPTNRVAFIDRSFIINSEMPKLKLTTETYSCETCT